MTFPDGDMLIIALNMTLTCALGVIVLYLGMGVNKKVSLLQKWCIPSAVTGGLIFSILHTLLRSAGIIELQFHAGLQTFFMQLFFTACGFAAGLGVLKKAGKIVVVVLISTVILTIMQNIIGVGIASAMGIHPILGVMAGSVPLVGGHGNAAAFAPIAEEWGVTGAMAVAMAAATYGLVAGSLLGNPIAEKLMKRHKIKPPAADANTAPNGELIEPATDKPKLQSFTSKSFQRAFFLVILALGAGLLLDWGWNTLFPDFAIVAHVWGLVMGVVFRIVADAKSVKLPEPEIESLSNIFLALFVSMAVYTMRLWELFDLAVPFIVILVVQTIFLVLFVTFITFRLCGKSYDSACIVSGQIGFGMGAVPVSMANLDAISQKYKTMSMTAYFTVPIVGALFSNFTNAIISNLFMTMFR